MATPSLPTIVYNRIQRLADEGEVARWIAIILASTEKRCASMDLRPGARFLIWGAVRVGYALLARSVAKGRRVLGSVWVDISD